MRDTHFGRIDRLEVSKFTFVGVVQLKFHCLFKVYAKARSTRSGLAEKIDVYGEVETAAQISNVRQLSARLGNPVSNCKWLVQVDTRVDHVLKRKDQVLGGRVTGSAGRKRTATKAAAAESNPYSCLVSRDGIGDPKPKVSCP